MRPAIQLLLLLAVVPAQLLISQWMTPSSVERTKRIQGLTKWLSGIGSKVRKWTLRLTDIDSWKKGLRSILQPRHMTRRPANQKQRKSATRDSSADAKPEHIDSINYNRDDQLDREPDTSPAQEVFKWNDFIEKQQMQKQWHPTPEEEHFSRSAKVRRRNNKKVKFRVGQVIKHKIWGYKGVIIGWDEFAKAPESWLRANHPASHPEWRLQPNYSILVHTHDRQDPQITYVPEDNIKIISNAKISHPHLKDYFYQFDGSQYLPNEELREWYPDD